MAATSQDTFATTGRQGLPIFLAVRHEDARMFAPQIATYRAAWRAAGHAAAGQVFLRAPGYLAATLQAARNDAEVSSSATTGRYLGCWWILRDAPASMRPIGGTRRRSGWR